MDLKANVKLLNYSRKMLLDDTEGMVPFPIRVQKPEFTGKAPQRLPRCAPEEAGVASGLVETLLRRLSEAGDSDTHGCLVIRGGKVLCEGFFAPYTPRYWHVTHSMCKSVMGTAIGMLADEGLLDLDEHVCDIFPDKCTLRTTRRNKAITVRHLLTMSSGANFREVGCVLDADWVKAFLEADVLFEPGTQFDYNSMNSYVLSAILQRKTGMTAYDYLTPRLFGPLGFGDVAWETCPLGVNKGGWGMYVFLEDIAKVGQLYLNKGLWNGQRLLSEAWVDEATQVHMVSAQKEEYGYQLWPRTSDRVYMFNGMFGQYVVMAPDLDMIVAVNAGAGHLFTRSQSYAAVHTFVNAVRTGEAGGEDGPRRLAFALEHLTFGEALPPFPVAEHQTLRQRLRARLLARLAGRGEDAPGEAQLAAEALAGKQFTFGKNNKGLLPMVIAVMNDWYTRGVDGIAFRKEEGQLWMDWTESGQLQRVPLGFGQAAGFTLDAGGNHFAAAATARFLYDEDRRPVLKVTVNLLESSSSRIVKLVLNPDGTAVLKLAETPPLMSAMESVRRTSPTATQALDLFKDADYLNYRVERFCEPQLKAQAAEVNP